MKSVFRPPLILTSCIALGLNALGGCKTASVLPPGSGAEPALPPPPVVVPPTEDKGIAKDTMVTATISADKGKYARGQIVHFTLTLRNTGKSAQKLTFNTGQSFDFTATAAGQTQPAWRWSQGKMFTMALRNMTLKAGQTQTWTATWEQNDSNGNAVPRGDYNVVGRITANGGIETQPITITLTD